MDAGVDARRTRRSFLAGFGAGAAAIAIAGAGVAVNQARPVKPLATSTPTTGTTAAAAATSATAAAQQQQPGEALPGIATLAGPVQRRMTSLPAGPLYWHIENFPNIEQASQHANDYAMSM